MCNHGRSRAQSSDSSEKQPATAGNSGQSVECKYINVSIYHLLCRTFGEQVAVSQIVDFDVLHVVAVRDVHLLVQGMYLDFSGRPSRGGAALHRLRLGMLNALAGLHGGIDSSGGGSWLMLVTVESFAPESQVSRKSSTTEPSCAEKKNTRANLPAAAAASTGDFFASASSPPARGLRSLVSDRRVGGDRERRSNLEGRLGSGSV